MNSTFSIFREFFGLGLTSFGGPTAHIAFFREKFVAKKAWLSESEFADLLALCQFLPGPASSQLGLAIGWKRGGWLGAFAAWTAFTLPSAIALTIFGLFVMKYEGQFSTDAGWLRGLQIAVVVVIAKAITSMWSGLCPSRTHQLIALVAAGIILSTTPAWMQLVVIALGAITGIALLRQAPQTTDQTGLTPTANPVRSGNVIGALCLIAFFALLVILPIAALRSPESAALNTFAAMFRSGALVFGGGHVVLPLLSEAFVETGWIAQEQFLAGYGATQAAPGPLFTFSAYLGSLINGPGGPWMMGAIALIGIFLPAWLLVLGVMPFWHRVASIPMARAALTGTNAAVVGILGAALYDPVWTGAIHSAKDIVFLLGVAAALLIIRLPSWAVVVAAAGAGMAFLTS